MATGAGREAERGTMRRRTVGEEDVHKLAGDQQSQTPTFHEAAIVVVGIGLVYSRCCCWV